MATLRKSLGFPLESILTRKKLHTLRVGVKVVKIPALCALPPSQLVETALFYDLVPEKELLCVGPGGPAAFYCRILTGDVGSFSS